MNTPLESATGDRPIRTFISVSVAATVSDTLAAIQARLQKTGADIGWVAPANIHLTILFLGTVFEAQTVTLSAAMDDIATAYPSQLLEIKGLGAFGRPNAPRILWAGLKGNLDPLLAMQIELAAAATRTGIYPDTKPFQPHLTIGRVRSSRRARELLHAIEPFQDTVFGPLEVNSVFMMKSELTPQGPIYTTLHESRLAAGNRRNGIN